MNLRIHFLFYCNTKCIYLLIYDLRGPNQTSGIILNEQKGFPKLVLVSTSVNSRPCSNSSTSANFIQIPEYFKKFAIPSMVLSLGNMYGSLLVTYGFYNIMFLVDDDDNSSWCTTLPKGKLCQGIREVTDKPRRFVLIVILYRPFKSSWNIYLNRVKIVAQEEIAKLSKTVPNLDVLNSHLIDIYKRNS